MYFLMQFKKSFIGMGWLIITPILGIFSWLIMNMAGVLKPGDVGIPYPVYVLLGTSIWGLFQGLFVNISQTLQIAQGFILQVSFPHHVLMIKQALQQLATFIITFVINLIVMFSYGIIPSWKIFLFPVLILPMFFIAASLGMLASVISVVVTGIQRITTFIFTFLMFVTPIIYSSKLDNPIIQKIINLNPLTYAIAGVRDIIIYGRMSSPGIFYLIAFMSFLFFLMTWRMFYVSEEKVIEKII